MVTQWYNQLHSTILAVELGLVKDEMNGTRQQLDPALRELTWAKDELWDYIQSTRDLVKVRTVLDTFLLQLYSKFTLFCVFPSTSGLL